MSFGLAHGNTLDAAHWLYDTNSYPPIPDDALQHPGASHINPRTWFDNPDAPFELEIGSGKGTFLIDASSRHTNTNFLGIEWAREFALYAADRFRRHDIPNVRMLCADATDFLHWRMPAHTCQTIHLYFSDPWPKKRHNKRRVIQTTFLKDVHRTLVPNGELRIVTDHDDYWQWMLEHFETFCRPDRRSSRFEQSPFTSDHASGMPGEIVGTNFERKYRQQGRPFHATVLRAI